MRLRVSNARVCLLEFARTLAHKFPEESPVPFVRCPPPLRRAISIYQAVIENIRSLVPVVLTELGERSSKPQVVAERGSPGDRANHKSGSVRCVRQTVERRLWAGNNETSEGSALYASTNLRCPVLKSPCQRGIEIVSGLNPGRRQARVAYYDRKCE